ncbi:sensor histidine kinase [Alteribacter natronophilus]|uniref:sensor histidine kinase n=1 Tax=Alteribacter natronophilus TaxID=2583810 RepID=UPI00110F3C93|nr:sensor histidine kinase [Alteribacter natronophilus]TMW72911.1 sensor histidine kinase [Alteribacter natronophilus]
MTDHSRRHDETSVTENETAAASEPSQPDKQPVPESGKKLHGVIWDGLRLQLKAAGAWILAAWVVIWLYATFYTGPADGNTFPARVYRFASDVELVLIVLFSAALLYLLISFIFSFSYTSGLKRAVTHLVFQLKQVQRGSLDKRIQLTRDDELTRLAGEINDMTDGYERQIRSMHRVLNENARLIDEKEKAAGLEERRKLARDLHDAVSQQLFAVSMSLGAIPRVLDTDPERAKKLINQVETITHAAQQELRALIMHLRPITLEGKGLGEALNALFSELSQKNPQLTFEWEADLPDIDPGIEDQLFRVIQEALSNALRHSGADTIRFSAKKDDDRLVVTLSDNGAGFDMEAKKEDPSVSYGLTTMKERTEEMGGYFSVLSYPGKGTTIRIRVPLAKEMNGSREDE